MTTLKLVIFLCFMQFVIFGSMSHAQDQCHCYSGCSDSYCCGDPSGPDECNTCNGAVCCCDKDCYQCGCCPQGYVCEENGLCSSTESGKEWIKVKPTPPKLLPKE